MQANTQQRFNLSKSTYNAITFENDSRTSEILDLNKYATITLGNDCFVDLEGGKLCLSYRLAVISEKMFASYVFPDKNQNPLCMCRMQITKEAVAILPLISGSY